MTDLVIAGKYGRNRRQSAYKNYGEHEDDVDLFQLWAGHRNIYEQGRLLGDSNSALVAANTSEGKSVRDNTEPINVDAYMSLRPAGFWRCLVVCTKRAATQHTRSLMVALFDVILHCGTGAFLGAASGTISLKSLAQTNLMFSLGLTMTVGLASLRVFGAERVVFWREAAPGAGMDLSPFPYFIGKNLVELPRLAILTSCLVAFFYPFVSTLCNPDVYYVRALASSWNISGWAVMLSIYFNDKSAQLILVILCLVFMLYSGSMTRLSDMSPVEYGISWLSPNRWLVEDLFVCHADTLSAAYRLPPQWYKKKNDSLIGYLITLTYSEHFKGGSLSENGLPQETEVSTASLLNFYCNIWFGVLTRFLGFLGLVYANRSKMSKPGIGTSIFRSVNTFMRICFPDLDMEHGWVSLKKQHASLMLADETEDDDLNNEWEKVTKSNAISRATESRVTTSSQSEQNMATVQTNTRGSIPTDERVNLGTSYGERKSTSLESEAMEHFDNPMTARVSLASTQLPDGWAAVEDAASDKSYYHNATTGETSWAVPTTLAISTSSPLSATEV